MKQFILDMSDAELAMFIFEKAQEYPELNSAVGLDKYAIQYGYQNEDE